MDSDIASIRQLSERARGARTSKLAAVGLAVTLAFGAAACTDDSNGDEVQTEDTLAPEIGEAASVESTPSDQPDGTTGSTDAGTETSADTAPETTTAAPVGAPDPEAAAATLYMSWKANDPATGATVAEPSAVEAMSTVAPGDYSLYNRCNTGEFGQSSCLYRGNPGTIQFSMRDQGGSWVVVTAIFSPA